MAPIANSLANLTNALVSSEQLLRWQQTHASINEAASAIFTASLLTQSAGVLLRLPQEVIATAVVILQRYLLSTSTDSKLENGVKDVSAATIYLCAKQSFYPLAPRSVINVYAYLTSKASPLLPFNHGQVAVHTDAKDYFVSEGDYERRRQSMFKYEKMVLAAIGFDTKVVLPYHLALTYLRALGTSSSGLAERVFEHLNGALLSPQLPYLTHQPNALAVAAIYLAAREVGAKLVEENWWEVFDVDREDLGFLVLSYGSLPAFASAEKERWNESTVSA